MKTKIWIVDAKEYSDFEEVERLVLSGKIALEVTEEDRQAEAELVAEQEREKRLVAAYQAKRLYEQTLEGQLESARAEGPRVTFAEPERWPWEE